MRHHLMPTRMANIKTQKMSSGRDGGKLEPWCTVGGNGKLWQFLKKLKIELIYNLAIALLGIYSN